MSADIFKSFHSNLSWLKNNTIYVALSGSHAYGTNIETSDLDYRGVCFGPKESYLGFQNNFEQAELKEPDAVIFEIRKFFSLASNANPNALEILFVEPENIVHINEFGKKLLANRELFLSKRIKTTMIGYATSQLRRIENEIKNMGDADFVSSRKSTRADSVRKFGYDTKNAMHLVRLYCQCKETLSTGKLVVRRQNAEQLIAIRNGAWTFNQILDFVQKSEQEVAEAFKMSKLPDEPDMKKLNILCMELLEEFFYI
jgi:predicted nucleotidyltransferase